MKTRPEAALVACIFLGSSIAAWADGCLVAHPATVIPINSGQQMAPPSNPDCENSTCDGAYDQYPVCTSSGCNPGSCSGDYSQSYCTGGPSPWHQIVITSNKTWQSCFGEAEGGCLPLMGNGEWTNPCQDLGSQPATTPCYTAWPQKSDPPCGS